MGKRYICGLKPPVGLGKMTGLNINWIPCDYKNGRYCTFPKNPAVCAHATPETSPTEGR